MTIWSSQRPATWLGSAISQIKLLAAAEMLGAILVHGSVLKAFHRRFEEHFVAVVSWTGTLFA